MFLKQKNSERDINYVKIPWYNKYQDHFGGDVVITS